MEPFTEPWLLGPVPGYDPVISHLLRASEHIRADADRWFGSITDEEIWQSGAGFHLKHLAGSTTRLCAYLDGHELSAEQVAEIAEEQRESGDLVANVHRAFRRYESLLRALPPAEFGSMRAIGRKRIPVNAVSLAIHIIEHGQRHIGQAITYAKAVSVSRPR